VALSFSSVLIDSSGDLLPAVPTRLTNVNARTLPLIPW
jgi:hypothetical protein